MMWMSTFVLSLTLALPLAAQGGEARPGKAARSAAAASSEAAAPVPPKASPSEAGRAALAAAKALAARVRAASAADRAVALEAAAGAYDQVAAVFAGEPAVGSVAAITAAELWRQHGSLPLAEKGYLLAARLDVARYGQRALLGAADMQRRQQRTDEAMATYGKVASLDPGSARAQDARLWQARMLQGAGRLDEAIVAFQGALESADRGAETIEACNWLALAWIDKNDLDAAGHVLAHAEQHVAGAAGEDPVAVERLQQALDGMSAKKALQRAKDERHEAGKDAAALEAARAGK